MYAHAQNILNRLGVSYIYLGEIYQYNYVKLDLKNHKSQI